MSKIVKLPNNKDKIFNQASEWIAKIDREMSEQEVQAFQSWFNRSEEHQKVFTEMAIIWDKMASLERLSELFPADNMAAARRQRTSTKWYVAAAASLLLAVSTFFVTLSPSSWGEKYVKYETAVGESSTITLADNSTVLLNTNSVLKVLYTDEYRLLKLEQGELHVDVAHEPSRPLRVVANNRVFQALGTAFNVQVKKADVELIVTDGKVVVADIEQTKQQQLAAFNIDAQQAPTVSKGEMVSLSVNQQANDAVVKAIAGSELTANLSWRKGNLIFTGQTLSEAMLEVSRYTRVKFQIADRSIEDIKIAGRFKIGDINGLLAALGNNFDIQANRVNKNLVILTKQS